MKIEIHPASGSRLTIELPEDKMSVTLVDDTGKREEFFGQTALFIARAVRDLAEICAAAALLRNQNL